MNLLIHFPYHFHEPEVIVRSKRLFRDATRSDRMTVFNANHKYISVYHCYSESATLKRSKKSKSLPLVKANPVERNKNRKEFAELKKKFHNFTSETKKKNRKFQAEFIKKFHTLGADWKTKIEKNIKKSEHLFQENNETFLDLIEYRKELRGDFNQAFEAFRIHFKQDFEEKKMKNISKRNNLSKREKKKFEKWNFIRFQKILFLKFQRIRFH